MKSNIDYSIYLVTDSKLLGTQTVESSVEQAILGGCTLVQLREKHISSLDFYNLGLKVKTVCNKYNIPLIINDRVDIALAINASGVHIGQSDLPARVVRSIIGNNKILGVSASSLKEAEKAKIDSADYLGVGAMFSTSTKTDAKLVSIDQLISIKQTVQLPVVVIGGINKETLPNFYKTNIDGIAVVSAILCSNDIKKATQELKTLFTTNML